MQYYAPERLTQNLAETPEGFLLCLDVVVARLGAQEYHPSELAAAKLNAGSNGMATVYRKAEHLFHPQTIATANGKDVVDEHPQDDPDRTFDIEPDNFRYVTRGVVLNPRRGTGSDSDALICDLLIKDKETIAAVKAGKREISLGYVCEYFKMPDGTAEQRNIFINHAALVESGRCGPRCSIRDHAANPKSSKELHMSTPSWKDRLKAAFLTRDEKTFEKTVDEAEDSLGDLVSGEGGEIHIHNHMGSLPAGAKAPPGTAATRDGEEEDEGENEDERPEWFKEHVKSNDERFAKQDERMGSVESMCKDMHGKIMGSEPAKVTDEAADEMMADADQGATRDSVAKARDSAHFEPAFDKMLADSEVILPGFTLPVFTRDASPTITYPAMCKHRRTVLELANLRPETRGIIDEVLEGKPLELAGMHCTKVRDMFNAVASGARAANRAALAVNGNGRRNEDVTVEDVIPHDNVGMNAYLDKLYGRTTQ